MSMSYFSSPDDMPHRNDVDLPTFVIHDAEDCRADDPVLEQLLSYFESRTRGRRLPCRADFNPADLKPLLPEICILLPVYGEEGVLKDIKVQLMGTEVASFYGEVTGSSALAHASPEISSRILMSCSTCIERRHPIVSVSHTLSEEKNYLSVGVIYIPLSDDGKTIDRLFLLVRVRRRGV
ncbi:MAG: PAS domain-containing protein [Alphaproteobacteria bacterium]|nr:MAG: PAS domain-containing protein [Alphaproteobacteria bacterium]